MSEVAIRPVAPAGTEGRVLPTDVYTLSVAAALVAALAAALTYFVPGILLGPPAANGNARGTALVMLTLAVPILLLSIWLVRRGSWRAVFGWLGALLYVGYNGFLFLFLTPFNRLFLLYVAAFSLTLFASLTLIRSGAPDRLTPHLHRLPRRGLAVFVWTVVALNALAWLQAVVPATLATDPLALVDGTGVATNAIYVQDLVFWLPGVALAAWWMWRERPLGALLTGSWVAFGVLEGIGVAVDQWFGHRADPTSPVASEQAVPLMLALALVNAVVLYFYVRGDRTGPDLPS